MEPPRIYFKDILKLIIYDGYFRLIALDVNVARSVTSLAQCTTRHQTPKLDYKCFMGNLAEVFFFSLQIFVGTSMYYSKSINLSNQH